MSTVFSLPKDWLDLQIMEETTRGTFEAPGAPTNAIFVAQTPELDWTYDLNLAVNKVTGSRDPAHVLATMPDLRFSMMIPNMVSPETINFLKRGFNLEAGAGTIERLFSGCLRTKLGATQYYLKMKGLIIGAGAIQLLGQGPWTVPALWMMGKLHGWDTSAPTNWTFVTPPTTVPLMSKDAGANHVTIRDLETSTDYTPSVRGLSIGFNNSLFPIPQTGVSEYADIIPTERAIQVRYVLNMKDLSIFNILKLMHEAKSTIVIKSATHTVTVDGGKLSPARIPVVTDTPITEAYVHVGKVGSLV